MTTKTVTKTVGQKNTGTTSHDLAQNVKVASKYVFDDDVTISQLTAYGGTVTTSRTTHVKGFIYSDDEGTPDALLGTTEEATCDWDYTPSKPIPLPFTNPVYLKAGTYWIGWFFEEVGAATDMKTRYAVGSTDQWATVADAYNDGPSDPFGVAAFEDRKLVIYATYTTDQTIRYPPAIKGYDVVTGIGSRTGIRWQEKSFSAEGRIWVFYVDLGAEVSNPSYFTSSVDGVSWTTPTLLKYLLERHGECLQAILEEKSDGNYVHVFTRIKTGGNYALAYRRGLLNSDGSITWTADWNTFWTAVPYNVDFYATLDSYGYPWVTWAYHPMLKANMPVYVIKSSRNDGVWATEGGYPKEISDVEVGRSLHNNFIVPLSNGKLYAFYFKAADQIYGVLWNGVSWSAEETVTTSKIIEQYSKNDYHETYSRAVAVDSDDNIHLVFVDYVEDATYPVFSYNLRYVKRTWGEGWGTETIIEPDILYKNVSPSIAKYGDTIEVFWTGSPSPDLIYSKTYDSDGWWSRNTCRVEEVDDTIPNENDYGYDGVINSFPKLYDGQVGLLWMTKGEAADTYDIRFGFRSQPSRTANATFNAIIRKFENIREYPSFEVTRHALTLGDRDSVTGWYSKEFETSTIKMIVIPKSAPRLALMAGYYIRLDALGLTVDYVRIGDEISDAAGHVYLVKSVIPVGFGDTARYFKCDLEEMPLHE